jgi:hypothetical protein
MEAGLLSYTKKEQYFVITVASPLKFEHSYPGAQGMSRFAVMNRVHCKFEPLVLAHNPAQTIVHMTTCECSCIPNFSLYPSSRLALAQFHVLMWEATLTNTIGKWKHTLVIVLA